jgi:predicted acyl esterase
MLISRSDMLRQPTGEFMRFFFKIARSFVGVILAIAPIFVSTSFCFGERVDSGVRGMALDHNMAVTMTDGIQLRVNIYRPDKPGRFPVLMLMGPYGKDTSYAESPAYKASWAKLLAKYPDLCKKSSCRYLRFEAPDPERWVRDGYIVIAADSRGTGASPGKLDPFSPREIEDYATLITWASRQPWSTGKVGLIGTSYQAINQWLVAARQPEGLAAILPWEGAFDYYREIAFYGGIPNTVSWKFWWDHQVVTDQHGNGASPLVDTITGQRSTGEALSPELLKQNRVSPVEAWVSQPLDGAFYEERTADPTRIVVPLLCVGNWEDWSIKGYMAAASTAKWLRIQTGDHLTPFYSEEAVAVQKRFFDHFLKGQRNGWESEAPVSLQVRRPDGTSWQQAAAWPLPKTQWDRYYLDAGDGGMSPDKGNASASEKSYPAMGQGVTFKTAPFAEDVNFTGPGMVKLWVRSSTPDMDIFATVRLIDPDGHDVTFIGNSNPRVPLNEGLLRVSQRAVDPAKSTEFEVYHPHTAVEPMTPGQLYEVDVNFQYPLSIVVPKGYRLALTVSGKDWQFAPNEQTVTSKDYEEPNAQNTGLFYAEHPNRDPALFNGTSTVVTGAEHASYVLLPHVPVSN